MIHAHYLEDIKQGKRATSKYDKDLESATNSFQPNSHLVQNDELTWLINWCLCDTTVAELAVIYKFRVRKVIDMLRGFQNLDRLF